MNLINYSYLVDNCFYTKFELRAKFYKKQKADITARYVLLGLRSPLLHTPPSPISHDRAVLTRPSDVIPTALSHDMVVTEGLLAHKLKAQTG